MDDIERSVYYWGEFLLAKSVKMRKGVDPIHVTDLFLYALKRSENLWFSHVFRGYRKRPVSSDQ